jgi:hypothetical protein
MESREHEMNQQIFQEADTASNTLKILEDLHSVFLESLRIARNPSNPAYALNVMGSEIVLSCLGHMITVTHRPVAIDGCIKTFEYDFLTKWKDDDISIFSLHLQQNGRLTLDANNELWFSESNHPEIKNYLLAKVLEELLRSPIYAPSDLKPGSKLKLK